MKNNEQSEKKMYFKNNIVIQNRCSLVAKWIDVNAERRNRLCFFVDFFSYVVFCWMILLHKVATAFRSFHLVAECGRAQKTQKIIGRWKVLREKNIITAYLLLDSNPVVAVAAVVVIVIVKFHFFFIIRRFLISINTRLQSVDSCSHIYLTILCAYPFFPDTFIQHNQPTVNPRA